MITKEGPAWQAFTEGVDNRLHLGASVLAPETNPHMQLDATCLSHAAFLRQAGVKQVTYAPLEQIDECREPEPAQHRRLELLQLIWTFRDLFSSL